MWPDLPPSLSGRSGGLLRGIVLFGAGVLLAACGGSGATHGGIAFTQAGVQAYLEGEVTRTWPGFMVGAAACPTQMPDHVGDSITCAVQVSDVSLEYQVQRLVAGRFEARPARPILVIRDVVQAVQAKLGTQAAEVRCGPTVVAQPQNGEPLVCQVTGSGPPRAAVVRVSPDGTITVTDT